jgi:Sulfotransferase family
MPNKTSDLCSPEDSWLFILGVNNSGTTLFARILESHPHVLALPDEGQLLTEALPRPDYENVVRLWTKKLDKFRLTSENDGYPAELARSDWMKFYQPGPGIRLEKSPPNTIRSLWLQEHFTNSAFIALVRHPYPVCEGIRRRMGCNIQEAATHWHIANSLLMADIPHLKKCHLVKYENLMSDPAVTLNQIAHFLNIDDLFNLTIIEKIESHSIDGRTQGLVNMNLKSIEKLTPEDRCLINEICMVTMSQLGYQPI